VKKILIVDDTKIHLSLFQVFLQGRDVEFLTAENGQKALDIARANRPDLIVSDVKMAGMDGFELCLQVHEDRDLARTPVVLVTSLTDDASRRRGRMVGAADFLNKPVDVKEIRRVVAKHLGIEL
jgi:CheY-like chemotaxis protein